MKEKTSARGGSASGRKKQFTYWLSVIVIGVVLGLGLQFVRAWTEPTTSPPNGNVGAPINTSGNYQTKSGGLSVLGGVNTTGLYASSYVSTPDVWSNTIHNSGWTSTYGLCLNGVCNSSWPSTSSTDTLQTVTDRGWGTSQPLYSSNYMQAPILYDANNSGYYVDPNGNSRMNALYSNNIQNYGQITNNGDIYSYGRICSAYGGWKCLDNIAAPACTCYFYGRSADSSCEEIVQKSCNWGTYEVFWYKHYGGGVGHWCSASGGYYSPCY